MKQDMTISFMTMRKIVGILGVSLGPLAILFGVLLGTGEIEKNFSSYYLTNVRDLLVGVLFFTGSFLIAYKGYDKHDNITTTIAGISAIGVGIFPIEATIPNNLFNLNTFWASALHLLTAIVFFVSLAYMSYFRFTKTDQKSLSKEKKMRNLIYKICSITIVLSLIFGGIHMFFDFFDGGPIFVNLLQNLMLISFGVSWFIKGYEKNIFS